MEQTQDRAHAPIRDRTLWFSAGAGIVTWAIHFFVIYVLVDQVCRNGWLNFSVLGLRGLQFTTLILTLAGAVLVAVAALSSYHAWRAVDADDGADQNHRYRFLTFSSLVLNITFIALMILTFAPTFIVPPCR
ncbi:MAG: hypothetical protein HC828_21155 [Blastochloris sp.]|nr:hypothetical protein [Blastochloris sp.]